MKKLEKIQLLTQNGVQFLLIFISVLLAFVLSEWSNKREDRITESKILIEIRNSLDRDLFDLENNLMGYKMSDRSVEVIQDWIKGKEIPKDSLNLYYQIIFRNYTPIINKSAYESLKATNIKLITNDSLRLEIISMYDYYYRIMEKLEDELYEMQDYRNHSSKVNNIIVPYMVFNDDLKLIDLQPAEGISDTNRNTLSASFWKINENRKFKKEVYKDIIDKIKLLEAQINLELQAIK